MKNYYIDTVQFTGNHYDFGLMQGEKLKRSPILRHRERQWAKSRRRHFIVNEQEAVHLFKLFMPRMLEELQGLADALEWSMEKALTEFGGYYIEAERSGCSILTSPHYFIRNYDSHPAFYEGRYTIYKPTDSGYAVIGPSMQITGRTDGMNEKGLVMGYNFINRVGSEDGFICNMIGRMVLELCANVEEAIAFLKEIPHRTSFNYVLLDPKGKTFIVEASPRHVVAREGNICTNHFEQLTDENRYRLDDSLRRYNKIKKQHHHNLSLYDAYRLLNGIDNGIFSEKYDASAGTIHTAVYLPEERKAWLTIGGNRMPIIFDFDRILQDNRSQIKQIKGLLQFHTPFVNMEAK